MEDSIASLAAIEGDVRPYKIHVSSKYLTLTKRKLELTRLPHEILLPRSRAWENGTPKGGIEPLIDFWLEDYSWRDREAQFNASLPQYRAAITLPGQAPLRVHFIHIKFARQDAVPLLLVPAFPLTNLSLIPLIRQLTEPEEGEQAFHVVAPSVPGLGFSDAFMFTSTHFPEDGMDENASEGVLESTAVLFDTLMQKLQYSSYLCSSTGSGIASPANIDYNIPRLLAQNHKGSCLGIHVIDPPLAQPSLAKAPLAWIKFGIAKFFHAPMFGYVKDDWRALTGSLPPAPMQVQEPETEADLESVITAPASTTSTAPNAASKPKAGSTATSLGLGSGEFRPNTFAYALCDSPVGLLSLVLAGLRHLSPSHTLSQTEIIDITQQAWLPGPEAAMRFWSSAAAENAALSATHKRSKTATAVTTFLGVGAAGEYKPPGWAAASHNVVYSTRYDGSAGLLVWERSSVIVEGVRGLAKALLKTHPELISPVLVEMTGVTIDEVEEEEPMTNINVITDIGDVQQMDVESPDTVVLTREL